MYNTISKDLMNYKFYLKNNDEISIKLRIVKHRIVDKFQVQEIAFKYSMWRNTVGNIIKTYNQKAPLELKQKIENNVSLSSQDLEKLWGFFLPKSRKPKSNSRQASISEQDKIISYFQKLKIWVKRLYTLLKRKNELWELTFAKIRWVYKRNSLKVKKVRTKNWETRSLYNYESLWAFEHWHFDTKVLADAKSLPKHIYENLKNNEHLPIYEWNIMFVWCRARFTAYSRWKISTFWLQFLMLVISHLRYCWVSDFIHMHTDWGTEFFSWSDRKKKEWNDILKLVDCDIDCYNPNWDIRKNVIERSHRSDDEEFLIPFGDEMKTKDSFMFRAQEYQNYRNNSRAHSWIAMNWLTPKEKLVKLWFYQADRILDFEVLFLDSCFFQLQRHLEYFYFQRELLATPLQMLRSDRKSFIDLLTLFPHLQLFAQNVLTYYRPKFFI